MFLWNDIKIKVESNNNEFFTAVKKYINAVFDHEPDTENDVLVQINPDSPDPAVPSSARKVKSLVFMVDPEEIRLDIFSTDNATWHIYKGYASIWTDYDNNHIVISLKNMPLSFEYYNTLIFFLHPLGSLLENFGYYRLHSSCVDIGGKAMLISGVSGSGKSTSAFSFPLHGGNIISDDLVFIKRTDKGYLPSSLTRLVKLRNDSIRRFYPELLQRGTAAVYEDETYYFMEDINSMISEEPHIKAITILEKTGKSFSSYSNVHPSEIIPHLFPSTIHTTIEAHTGRKFIFITDMLNELECRKVFFGTDMHSFFKTAHEMLQEIVDG